MLAVLSGSGERCGSSSALAARAWSTALTDCIDANIPPAAVVRLMGEPVFRSVERLPDSQPSSAPPFRRISPNAIVWARPSRISR